MSFKLPEGVAFAAPSGVVYAYTGATAPTGWLLMNGNTIGSAASGATSRANADTINLYTLLWDAWNNTALPIQDSAGNPTTRGASASADFSANKRLPLPDMRGVFVRGAGTNGTANYGGATGHTPAGGALGNKGRQFTARNGLTASASASSVSGSISTSGAGGHTHTMDHSTVSGSSAGRLGPAAGGSSGLIAQSMSNPGDHTHGVTHSLTAAAQTITVGAGDSETTPAFLALNYIIKT